MIFLFGAYSVFWVITFAYVWSMINRQKQLNAEVSTLKQLLDGQAEE